MARFKVVSSNTVSPAMYGGPLNKVSVLNRHILALSPRRTWSSARLCDDDMSDAPASVALSQEIAR
jgi:hypothetical protein